MKFQKLYEFNGNTPVCVYLEAIVWIFRTSEYFLYNITLRKDKYIQICLQSMYSFKPSRLYFHGFSSKYESFHVMKCPVYIYSMTKLCLVRFYFNFDFYDENSEHFTAAKMRLCKVLVKSNVDRKHLYY